MPKSTAGKELKAHFGLGLAIVIAGSQFVLELGACRWCLQLCYPVVAPYPEHCHLCFCATRKTAAHAQLRGESCTRAGDQCLQLAWTAPAIQLLKRQSSVESARVFCTSALLPLGGLLAGSFQLPLPVIDPSRGADGLLSFAESGFPGKK